MEIKELVNIGDWISCSIEGYGVISKIHPIYWDIFCPEIYDGDNREYEIYIRPEDDPPVLGGLATVKLQCKRFCKYDGTLIRSHKIRHYSIHDAHVQKVSAEEMDIISTAIKKHPKEYEAFLKLDRSINTYFEVYYWVNNIEEAEFAAKLFCEQIRPQLPEKFTAEELKKVMEINNCPFKLDEPIVRGRTHYPTTKKLIELILFYTIGDYVGKKTLFNHAKIWYYGMKSQDHGVGSIDHF